jgi:hypothetical protein
VCRGRTHKDATESYLLTQLDRAINSHETTDDTDFAPEMGLEVFDIAA